MNLPPNHSRKRSSHGPVSLARILSKLGYCSRSLGEKLIRSGSVSVNGRIEKNPSARFAMDSMKIAVKGVKRSTKKIKTIALHKPVGVITSRSDERGRKTIYHLLGDTGQWLFPIGRLDKETSGLLLLTNDNRLGEILTNPHSKVPKTYVVILDRPLTSAHAMAIRRGMRLGGEQLLPAEVVMKEGTIVEITIHEGKNRQIRRMCEALGYTVKALTRTRIGRFELGILPAGEWKVLHVEDLALLLPHSGTPGTSRGRVWF